MANNINDFRQVVTTAGTRVALRPSSTPATQVDICAETDNTGLIVVGGAGVIASLSTRRGIPLAPGDVYSINPQVVGWLDLANLFIDSTVNGDGVTVTYFEEVKLNG